MAQCDFCGKSKQFGNHIRHAHSIGWALRAPKKNRVFKPNVQKTKFVWPATRTDGTYTGTNAIPEGQRFRLRC